MKIRSFLAGLMMIAVAFSAMGVQAQAPGPDDCIDGATAGTGDGCDTFAVDAFNYAVETGVSASLDVLNYTLAGHGTITATFANDIVSAKIYDFSGSFLDQIGDYAGYDAWLTVGEGITTGSSACPADVPATPVIDDDGAWLIDIPCPASEHGNTPALHFVVDDGVNPAAFYADNPVGATWISVPDTEMECGPITFDRVWDEGFYASAQEDELHLAMCHIASRLDAILTLTGAGDVSIHEVDGEPVDHDEDGRPDLAVITLADLTVPDPSNFGANDIGQSQNAGTDDDEDNCYTGTTAAGDGDVPVGPEVVGGAPGCIDATRTKQQSVPAAYLQLDFINDQAADSEWLLLNYSLGAGVFMLYDPATGDRIAQLDAASGFYVTDQQHCNGNPYVGTFEIIGVPLLRHPRPDRPDSLRRAIHGVRHGPRCP